MPPHPLVTRLRLLTWAAALLVLAVPVVTMDSGATRLDRHPASVLMGMPPFLIVAWGLVQLSGFYRGVERGEPFTGAAVLALRRFGWALVAAAMLLVPCRALALYIDLQPLQPGGWIALLGRPQAWIASALGAVVGLIAVVFARVLDRAAEIAEENASFL